MDTIAREKGSRLDYYLFVGAGGDLDCDVFVDRGGDDFATVSAVEVSDIRAPADETDSQGGP